MLASAGVLVSFFWSAVTVIYFLLRWLDDKTSLQDVFSVPVVENDELLALVGVAASSQQPPIERPAVRPSSDGGQDERPEKGPESSPASASPDSKSSSAGDSPSPSP